MESTKPEIRTISSLSWEERKAMIEEYLSGTKTKAEVWKKYTGQPREYGHMLQWKPKSYTCKPKTGLSKTVNSLQD